MGQQVLILHTEIHHKLKGEKYFWDFLEVFQRNPFVGLCVYSAFVQKPSFQSCKRFGEREGGGAPGGMLLPPHPRGIPKDTGQINEMFEC